MSGLERNGHPSRQSGCLLPRRPPLLSPVGLAGQSQHSGLKAQSRFAASYRLALGFVSRLELQPVFPCGSVDQFGICEEPSLGQDLVIIAYKRPAVSKGHLALLQSLHELSYSWSPFLPQASDTVDHRWLGKLANQTVRHESGSFRSSAEGCEGPDPILERENELMERSIEEVHRSVKVPSSRRQRLLPVDSNYCS